MVAPFDSASNTSNNDSTPKSKDHVLIPTNPYYLHPQENSSVVLVKLHVNNNNFESSSISIKHTIYNNNKKRKNNLKIINGNISSLTKNGPFFMENMQWNCHLLDNWNLCVKNR